MVYLKIICYVKNPCEHKCVYFFLLVCFCFCFFNIIVFIHSYVTFYIACWCENKNTKSHTIGLLQSTPLTQIYNWHEISWWIECSQNYFTNLVCLPFCFLIFFCRRCATFRKSKKKITRKMKIKPYFRMCVSLSWEIPN